MRFGRWLALGALGATFVAAAPALAAELRWSGPEDCAWAAQVKEQVEAQIDGSLAAVEGIDFELTVREENSRKWRLTLVSVERASGDRRTRELAGESCGEVANAAAVALAMAIREQVDSAPKEKPAQPVAAGRPAPPSVPQSPKSVRAARPMARDPVTPSVTAAALLELGALPDPAPGVGLEVGVTWRLVYLGATGALFAPAEVETGSARGGEFRLWTAGAIACSRRGVADGAWVHACLGYEIGELEGRGTGITDPRSETTTWQALRGEVGGQLRLGSGFSAVVRGGAVVPFERREFVLDGSEVVHRPGFFGARFLAGLNVDF